MARIRSGVLGNTRGKVAGVVASQWKDKNYLREYVKPANPNTTAQQAQRSKMTLAVAFCKALVGPVFNYFTDKFQKSMSGFNFFIKRNIAHFDGSTDYSAILVTEGKLTPLASFLAEYDTATGEVVSTWDENLGNDALATDQVTVFVYDKVSGLWYLGANAVDRDSETQSYTIPTGLVAANLECYLMSWRFAGTIVTIISNTVHAQATAA